MMFEIRVCGKEFLLPHRNARAASAAFNIDPPSGWSAMKQEDGTELGVSLS
jgi:hypothetical protein